MKSWLVRTGVAVLTIAVGGRAPGQVPPAQPPVAPPAPLTTEDVDANRELAERFCEIGLQLARKSNYSPLGLRQSAALLDAAVRLNPDEPRFLRLLAYWREQTGQATEAIDAWKRYLGPNAAAGDTVAQSEMIDLYLARMQANDEKIKYIRQVLANPKLDPTVKAHIAAEGVSLLDQRSRPEAMAMLAQARQFYPLPEVTLLEWQMLPADATPVQRLATLLNIVRANPTNVAALGETADLLSANGMTDKALIWYGIFVDVNAINDTPTTESSMLNYLAERFRAGQATVANEQLDRILQQNTEDQHAWFLRLTTQRTQESQQMLEQARNVFARRLADLCDRIQKAPVGGEIASPRPAPPATQPAAAGAILSTAAPQPAEAALPAPDLNQSIARVKGLDPKVQSVLVDTLAEQAWFEIYYDHKPTAAVPAIEALKKLVPADNVAMKRLQGWYAIASGDEADGARALLTPQKDQDALSTLGLFELEHQKNHAPAAAALEGKLLSFPQTGELAAVIYQATKAHAVKGAAATADTAAIKAELDKFPIEWLEIIHNPARFYTITGEPFIPGHPLGDPMLGQVTLTNIGKFDISIGASGLLKPVYTFDAQLRGVEIQVYPAVLSDRIMGKIVLRPGESISQVVRIDQGDLNHALYTLPAVPLFVEAAVVINAPANRPAGRPQAGGTTKAFGKVFSRTQNSLALVGARERIFAALATGPARDKILDLDLISVYYSQYVQHNSTDAEMAAAADFLNAIDRTRSDPDVSVNAWACYCYALLSNDLATNQDIHEMMQSSWQSQLLGLAAMQKALPRNIARQWAAEAASNPNADPPVKAYAAGIVEFLNQQAATQPVPIRPDTPATKPAPPVRSAK